jgi:hypothetical protein
VDPNANVREQVGLARQVLDKADLLYMSREELEEVADMGVRLAELVVALDGWLGKGGFPPERWKGRV